jgi:Fibronectin type III domain.
MAQAGFSGSSNYIIDIDAALVSQSGMTSTIYWRLLVIKTNHYGHRAWGNTGSKGNVSSSIGPLWSNGNLTYNFQNGSTFGTFTIAEGTFVVTHRADGNAEYVVDSSLTLHALGTAATGTGWRSLPRIRVNTVPDAPTPIAVDNATADSLRFRFSGNNNGGSPILEWQIHYGTDPRSGQHAAVSDGTSTITGLSPGTKYYFWARGRNAIGWGPFSNPISGSTLVGVRIKHNGAWKQAIPYVKVNGVWRLAQPHVKVNGVWKKSN